MRERIVQAVQVADFVCRNKTQEYRLAINTKNATRMKAANIILAKANSLLLSIVWHCNAVRHQIRQFDQ
jgi:hypothetical protein